MPQLTQSSDRSSPARGKRSVLVSVAGYLLASGLVLVLLAAAVEAEPPRPFTPPPAVEPLPELAPASEAPVAPEPKKAPATSAPSGDDGSPASPTSDSEPANEAGTEEETGDSADEEEEDTSRLPLAQLRSFAEIFGRIKSDYVEKVDDETLLAAAVRGMLAGLDPHSTFLDEEDYEDLQVGTKGEFGGLGIEVGMEDGFVKVIAPIDDTPAKRAGVQAGDLIVRIDDKPVKGMSLNDAVELMRGEPGTTINLTIMREGEDKPLKIAIKRDIIQVASVKTRWLEPGYPYVRIANFQSRTTEDMREQIEALVAAATEASADVESGPAASGSDASPPGGRQSESSPDDGAEADVSQADFPIKGLVLDLRNNPGGVLNSAVGVSDAFLRTGLIVYTQGRNKDARMEFKAGPDDIIEDAPMVVLVNGGSASASEIVAGALQDQGRAIIMGANTFGKGSVQTIVPVDAKTALKLTTARYYTPSGRSIQAHGIEPDISLEHGTLSLADQPAMAPLKEANLIHHLEQESAPTNDQTATPESDQPLAVRDYQLNEALNVLKALNIAHGRGQSPSGS